ncbi:YciI family protein [Brevibacterium sp. CFH 10365]|uniref:YciI family protein n=1 Tax=Brevibacterium sp. CFH 10365 TaxID=2585207 RepID=UPI001D0D0E6F|nr:YciI family protein [Brevibacterium sp. CFH 10365]
MLIMRTVDQVAVERMAEADFNEMIAAMGTYNESMINAGVLSDGAGLADPSEGAVVDFSGSEPTTTPGAYGNLRERINGPEDFPEDNEWIQKEQEWIEQGRLNNG